MPAAKKELSVERTCYECGKKMVGRRENYSYQEVGLKSVVLLNVLVYHCQCGAIVPEIPYAGVLHNCIALSILKKKSLLTSDEIRFIRKVAGYSVTELARVMGMQTSAVSRWEHGKTTIGKDSDRMLRLICFTRCLERLAGTEIKQDDGSRLVDNIARIARMVRSLNLTAVLQELEDTSEGDEQVRIDPEYLGAEALPQFVQTAAAVQ